eukprot:7803498-Pyramimonas_sp.AAC.1
MAAGARKRARIQDPIPRRTGPSSGPRVLLSVPGHRREEALRRRGDTPGPEVPPAQTRYCHPG